MGSSFKSSNSYSHNQRGHKSYALVLLLAFGAAILGVMVLHKLREKRIFTLLVKEKDHELLTLHLLFQREKEFNQEARRKIEEMKNKVYSLRTHKLELDRRLSEMESTISSLKDERNVIEFTLEEKKNKIQMLTAGMNSSSSYPPQVTALKDIIKMKDAEIEDLKFLLKKLDMHSERTSLVTSFTSVGTKEANENDGDSQLNSDSFSDSTMGENGSQNDNIIQNVNDHMANVEHKKLNDVKDGVDLKKENTKSEEKETADYKADQGPKVTEDKAEENSTSHEEEQQKLQENQTMDGSKFTSFRRGGLKLEKPDDTLNALGSRVRRKHSKGRRRETQRNRRLGDDLNSESRTEITPVLTSDEQQKFKINQDEKAESEIKTELSHKNQSPLSNKLNHTTETRNDGQSWEEIAEMKEEQGRKSAEIKTERTEEIELVNEHGSLVSKEQNENAKTQWLTDGESGKFNDNAKKQIFDKISNQLHDQEADSKQENKHSTKSKKHENDNEQENESFNEESEVEDSEDTEAHEPEIDRDDIRRFSELDPDEEVEETEF